MSTNHQSSAFRPGSETHICAMTASKSLLLAAPHSAVITEEMFLITHLYHLFLLL